MTKLSIEQPQLHWAGLLKKPWMYINTIKVVMPSDLSAFLQDISSTGLLISIVQQVMFFFVVY